MRFAKFALAIISGGAFAYASAPTAVISNLKRTWDLSSNTPEETIALAFQGSKSGSGLIESFIWSVSQPHAMLLSDLTYSFKDAADDSSDSKGSAGRTPAERPKIVPCNKAFGWSEELIQQSVCFKIPLGTPIKASSDEKVVIYLSATYLPLAEPFPSKVKQNENQYLRFQFPVQVLSQYRVMKQKTIVKLGSANIKDINNGDSGISSEKKGRTVQFSGSDDKSVDPFTRTWGSIQYEHNFPYLLVLSLNRTMFISHWADDILVEESYDLRHEGAKLKKQFSRIDYQRSRMMGKAGGTVPSVFVPLPKDAFGATFVDEVGNVSTSRIILEDGHPVLNLQPRYPLFGGWNYTWTHTFHLPLSNYLKVVAGGGEKSSLSYKLTNLPLASLFQTVPVDRLQVTIVFPEGSESTAYVTPFEADSVTNEIIYTYLDTTGRPATTIIKNKVTLPMIEPFEVSYKLSASQMVQKPLVLIASFFLVFALFMVISRVEFSISSAEEDGKKKSKSE